MSLDPGYRWLRTGQPARLQALHGSRYSTPEAARQWRSFNCQGGYWLGRGTYFSLFDESGHNPISGQASFERYESWVLADLDLRSPFVIPYGGPTRMSQIARLMADYLGRPFEQYADEPGDYSSALRDRGHDAVILLTERYGGEMGSQVCLMDPSAGRIAEVYSPDELRAVCGAEARPRPEPYVSPVSRGPSPATLTGLQAAIQDTYVPTLQDYLNARPQWALRAPGIFTNAES